MHDILVALALMMVIEGVWPFLSPSSFRRALIAAVSEGDGRLRWAGLASMLAGVGLLYLVN